MREVGGEGLWGETEKREVGDEGGGRTEVLACGSSGVRRHQVSGVIGGCQWALHGWPSCPGGEIKNWD